jgi:hypothetical protein
MEARAMNCTNCGKPESSHPVVPWFGKKCYGFVTPEPPKPRAPSDGPAGYSGSEFAVGIRGNDVLVEFYRGAFPQFSILPTPDQARFIARQLNAMADIIDPPTETPKPNPPEIPNSGKAVEDGGAGGGDER